jgi:hypothetical protein
MLPRVMPIIVLLSLLHLAGCSHQFPKRPYVDAAGVVGTMREEPSEGTRRPRCVASAPVSEQLRTPETNGRYVLHFVEFDDHGWLYRDRSEGFLGPRHRVGNPREQLDCVIRHVAHELEREKKVSLFLYVHGWHHNAGYGDSDVAKFRWLLDRYSKNDTDAEKTIGIFVGWDGETLPIPYVSDVLTFFSRKAAAHRVADGQVRELFGRLRGLRTAYNRNSRGEACAQQTGVEDGCKFRIVMIGHSFGGLVLYSAVQPYLLETLTTGRDVKAKHAAVAPRAEGIADLVVLANPAFEATLFEALHQASVHHPDESMPPLMVSITSLADNAVGKGFQLARNLSTLNHYPANSALASEALRDTMGYVSEYLTHDLCIDVESCEHRMPELRDSEGKVMRGPDGKVRRFVPRSDEIHRICGKQLWPLADNLRRPIWNVRTDREIVADHNDILGEHTINFFEYVYALIVSGPERAAEFGQAKSPRCETLELPKPGVAEDPEFAKELMLRRQNEGPQSTFMP